MDDFDLEAALQAFHANKQKRYSDAELTPSTKTGTKSPQRATTQTSKSSPIRVHWVEVQGRSGKLGMTFAPGKKAVGMKYVHDRSLRQDLERLRKTWKANVLINLLEKHEYTSAEIEDIVDVASEKGIKVIRFPIVDRSVPKSPEALLPLIKRIDKLLKQGKNVVVHCMGGLGRTGTVVGSYLVWRGQKPTEVLAHLVDSRGSSRCPETQAQKQFVSTFPAQPVNEDCSEYKIMRQLVALFS